MTTTSIPPTVKPGTGPVRAHTENLDKTYPDKNEALMGVGLDVEASNVLVVGDTRTQAMRSPGLAWLQGVVREAFDDALKRAEPGDRTDRSGSLPVAGEEEDGAP